MITAFRDCGRVLLGHAMPRGETIIPDACIRTLKELRKPFKAVRPPKHSTYILRQPMPTGGENETGKNYRVPNILHFFLFFFLLLSVSPLLGGEGCQKFLSLGIEPFLGGSGFSIMQSSTQVWSIGKPSWNSVTPSTLEPWCSTLRFPHSLSGAKFETYVHVIRAVRPDYVSITRHGNDKAYVQLFPVGTRP